MRAVFLWMAHREASAALAASAVYTDARDERNRVKTKELKEWIETVLDVQGGATENPLTVPDTSTTEEEREYRHWCLSNRLYLTPLNDLGPHSVAGTDSIISTTETMNLFVSLSLTYGRVRFNPSIRCADTN